MRTAIMRRSGCGSYLAARAGSAILQMRLGRAARVHWVDYGEANSIGGARVSLHPAGHMTGSAQVRIEVAGEVCVVSGDYKLQSDPTCQSFEPVRCHTFVTESTFGLPLYRWDPPSEVFAEINDWWRSNQARGAASLLLGYTVGKAQRLLAAVDASIGPIFAHGAILSACRAYRDCGVKLPELGNCMTVENKFDWSRSLIVAPPSALGTTWLRRFGNVSTGMASGWMRVRGIRRRRVVDRGFVLSDHVDWQDLLEAIALTGATSVWVTHGYTQQVVRALQARGLDARVVRTEFTGEASEVSGAVELEDETDETSESVAHAGLEDDREHERDDEREDEVEQGSELGLTDEEE